MALNARHEGWASRLPREVEGLWAFVMAMDGERRLMLLAHCIALSVNVVQQPNSGRPRVAADDLARSVGLDMGRHWEPTAQSYFGRVTKTQIALAVREAMSEQAADNIAAMKKGDMAMAAERLVGDKGWLPQVLRLPVAEAAGAAAADAGDDSLAIAAE